MNHSKPATQQNRFDGAEGSGRRAHGASALACLEIGSPALGYACLATVAKREEIDVVEASIVGGARFMILLRGPAQALSEAAHEAQRSATVGADGGAPSWESYVADAEPAGFLDAYYSLSDQALGESLVVCEASSMGALLAASEALASGSARPMDVKALRGSSLGAIGFFTGPASDCGLAAEAARARVKALGLNARVETIDHPPAKFREHFSLDGRG